jgi:L-fuconolactonase
MTKIDSHQHFWMPARGDYGWMNGPGLESIRKPVLPPDLAPLLAQSGISKTVLVQAAPTVHETEYLLGIADATEFVAKVVGWVDFENYDDLRHMQRLARHPKFSGVRPMIQDLPDPEWMHGTRVAWAFDAIVDLDLTFDALGFPIHLEPFRRLFDRYPKMRVVVDHCMKPNIRDNAFDTWASGLREIADATPAFCKLSGLATEASGGWTTETLRPYALHVLDCFGPKRVMWGSDWPVLNLNGSYQTWHDTAFDFVLPAAREQVFGATAASFYRIS